MSWWCLSIASEVLRRNPGFEGAISLDIDIQSDCARLASEKWGVQQLSLSTQSQSNCYHIIMPHLTWQSPGKCLMTSNDCPMTGFALWPKSKVLAHLGFPPLRALLEMTYSGPSLCLAKDRDNNASQFLHRTNELKMLSKNLEDRRLTAEQQLQDYNVLTNAWETLPPADVYVAGFPCTPWSRIAERIFT